MSKKVRYFAATNNEMHNQQGDQIMLGVFSPREPISPEFSKEIRAALWRSMTGNLTNEERQARRRCRAAARKWRIIKG